ncbi:hypothetical protein NO1_1677 [Candidatus Termititenax aidoneus]|uniref:Uncharacterized protein n=1 Tax=Termititenax aidoneus TaxID=2218524 RepID=A0A388TCD6_TERA1|nr:hypothetical protein NO1_1677 [Candidatus Termititenax aidoneus]
MKKIILAIFTIMLTLAIFGCGKAQQASGGGSSGGGGGGGNTAQTFSINGVIPAAAQAETSSMSVQGAADFKIKVLKFADSSQLDGEWTPNASGYYKIDGLPLGTVFVVVVENDTIKMKNLAFGSAKDKGTTKLVDLTPTSTATVEVVSKNTAAREMLGAFAADADIDAAVQNVQDEINSIYDSNPNDLPTTNTTVDESAKLDAIEAAAIHTYTLTVGISPNIAALDDVRVDRIPSANAYLKNTSVKLSLLCRNGWTGKSPVWSGIDNPDTDTAYIVMDSDKAVTANVTTQIALELPDIFLSWNSRVDGYLSVSPNPNNKTSYYITEPDSGESFKIWRYFYDEDQTVTLNLQGQAGVVYRLGVWENPPPDHGWPDDEDEADFSYYNEISDGAEVTLTMDFPQMIFNLETFRVLGVIPSGTTKTIDGNDGDWSSTYAALFDDTAPLNGDRNPKAEYAGQYGLKIESIKIARDANYLYFLWEQQDASFSEGLLHYYIISIRPYENTAGGDVMLQLRRYNPASTDGGAHDSNGDGFYSRIFYSGGGHPHPIDTTDTAGKVSGNFYEARVAISVVKDEFPSSSGEWAIKSRIMRMYPDGWRNDGAAALVPTRVTF